MRGDTVALDTLVAVHDNEANTTVTRLRNGEQDLAPSRCRWKASLGTQFHLDLAARPMRVHTGDSFLPVDSKACGLSRGIECGTVHDIILDRNSARVAFLSIDVYPKFVDAVEGRRLIPWSVVSLTLDGVVRVDPARHGFHQLLDANRHN